MRQPPPKFHDKVPERRKIMELGGSKKNKRDISGPHPSGHPLFFFLVLGSPHSGPQPSGAPCFRGSQGSHPSKSQKGSSRPSWWFGGLEMDEPATHSSHDACLRCMIHRCDPPWTWPQIVKMVDGETQQRRRRGWLAI